MVLVNGEVVVQDGELKTGDVETIARELAEVHSVSTITTVRDGIGESVRRPDGIPKVKGEFAYSSDMWAEDMLWGATLRSPAPAGADPRRSSSAPRSRSRASTRS